MSSLVGTAVTILYGTNTTSTVVTADPPQMVRERLNTALGQPEPPAFFSFTSVDVDQTIMINLREVLEIVITPEVLADPDAPAPRSRPKSRPKQAPVIKTRPDGR